MILPNLDAGGNILVTNQLKIDIKVISNAQAWAEQVRGVYYFLYPHIVEDFAHNNDIQSWIDDIFAQHTHPRPGCEGGPDTLGPSSTPLIRGSLSSQIPDKQGKALLESNSVLGKVRKGMSDLVSLVAGIDRINKER